MFTNKHVIIAMIVAPILGVLGWIAVGQIAGEKPSAAQPGQSYPLVEKSNCRYESGACDLENEDFRLRLTLEQGPRGPAMLLSASHSLEGAILGIGAAGGEIAPGAMRAVDGQGLMWRRELGGVPAAGERIRLVARAEGSSYFAEASTIFLQPEAE